MAADRAAKRTRAAIPPGHRAAADRVERDCAECGQTDDHPRDVKLERTAGGALTWVPRHIDCCAARGCDDCRDKIEHAAGKWGPELTSHLIKHGDELAERADQRMALEAAQLEQEG